MTFQPASVLFDKGVIRRLYQFRVRLALGVPPTTAQAEAAKAFAHLSTFTERLYVTEQTANVLRKRPQRFSAAILFDTQVLKKGRYLRRWARRLRELDFSPEDAIVIAYGSFGIDLTLPSVGVEVIVTSDLKLASHFNASYTEIRDRFERMVLNIPDPHSKLTLPAVVTTAAVLTLT